MSIDKEKVNVKTCPCCKEEKDVKLFYGDGKTYDTNYWCKPCYNRYKYQYVKDRKKAFVRSLGNECEKCGIKHDDKNTAIFDFHHRNEKTKKADWTRMRNWSLERQRDELKKCILVCANCHRLIHAIGRNY